jgi:cell division protein ZapA
MNATTAGGRVSDPVSIHILDREFLIACRPDERSGLIEAAALLDDKMREVRKLAHGSTLDRIAVLAALNLAHELLALQRSRDTTESSLGQQLQALSARLDAALS